MGGYVIPLLNESLAGTHFLGQFRAACGKECSCEVGSYSVGHVRTTSGMQHLPLPSSFPNPVPVEILSQHNARPAPTWARERIHGQTEESWRSSGTNARWPGKLERHQSDAER